MNASIFAAWRLAVIAEGVPSWYLARHPDDAAAPRASRDAVLTLAEFATGAFSNLA